MAPSSPPSLLVPDDQSQPPTAFQASTLTTLLAPHLKQALLRPPSSDVVQYLSVALALAAGKTMDDRMFGKRRVYEDEELVPLRVLRHLTSSANQTDGIPSSSPLIVPTQTLLNGIIAYPEYASTLKVLLDDARRGNKAVFGELDLQVVGPVIKLMDEQRTSLGLTSNSGSSRTRGVRSVVTTMHKCIFFLLTLARSHPLLSKSILTSSQSLDVLNQIYSSLNPTCAMYYSSAGTNGTEELREAIGAKSSLLILLNTLLGTLQQSEREWKLGNLEDPSFENGIETSQVHGKARQPMINASLVEDYVTFFPDANGSGAASGRTRVDERIIDILRSISTSGPAERETHNELGAAPALRSSALPKATSSGSTSAQPRATSKETASIATIHAILPHLPSHLLLEALRHPKFSNAGDEGLINALLEGDLPKGLEGLSAVLRGEEVSPIPSTSQSAPMSRAGSRESSGGTTRGLAQAVNNATATTSKDKGKKPFKRDNIWDEAPMDFDKLRIGKDESALSNLTAAIPDHIRSSILRLTEQQQEEEAAELEAERQEVSERRERARAAAAAGGGGGGFSSSGLEASARIRPAVRVKTVAFEEELEDWERQDMDELGMKVKRPSRGHEGDDYDEDLGEGEDLDEVEGLPGSNYASGSTTPAYRSNPTHNPSWNPPIQSSSSSPYGTAMPDADPSETYCELTYIRDPSLFDRDGATRRSKGRDEMKKKTGWGDEQLEGWRIMLERNPRKDKILSRHGSLPPAKGPQSKQAQSTSNKQPSRPSFSNATPRRLPAPPAAPETKLASATEAPQVLDEDWGGGPAVPLDPWDPPNPKNMQGFNPRNDGSKRGIPGGGGGKDKAPKRDGSGGGGGGDGGGGGRGGSGGGTGSGGQRSGASKGSRGHSNAARTRGHDKKMARMGVI